MRRVSFVVLMLAILAGALPGTVAAQALEPAGAAPGFVGVTPSRILDTRDGVGAARGAVPAGGSIDLQVGGRGGVPASGVSAVVINVTVTEPTASGYVTVWPTGTQRPLASNLNFTQGRTVPNLVVVKVGAGGKVSLFNSSGATHLIADVSGYYTTNSQLVPVSPVRLLDTRDGTGGVNGARSGTVDVQVAGNAGIPLSEATAVIMNVTVTAPQGSGYLTVWPTGASRPNASNVNFTKGDTVPNLVIAKIGAGGKVSFYSSSTAHVVMDVLGYVRTPVMLTEALAPVDHDCLFSCIQETPAAVQGQMRYNSLRAPSSGSSPVWVEYNLGRQWGTLSTTLTYDDNVADAASVARFRILGDGNPLVDKQLRFGEALDVTADVRGVLRLRFEVTGLPGQQASGLTFADPQLTVAAGAQFPPPRDYSALVPARILDTRSGIGAAAAAVQPASSTKLQVLGQGGVPAEQVGSVVLNMTVTEPAASGYLTVWPSGVARPLASNLNFTAGLTVPNLVIVPVGRDGMVQIYNGSGGATHIIADVLGYFPDPAGATSGPKSVMLTEALDIIDHSCLFSCITETATTVQGQTRFNSLRSPSAGKAPVWAEYNLGRHWRTLNTRVGFDDALASADSVVRFRILGDGVPIYDRTLTFGQYEDVAVNVAGVLRLRFEVTGAPDGRAPVFADPRLAS